MHFSLSILIVELVKIPFKAIFNSNSNIKSLIEILFNQKETSSLNSSFTTDLNSFIFGIFFIFFFFCEYEHGKYDDNHAQVYFFLNIVLCISL